MSEKAGRTEGFKIGKLLSPGYVAGRVSGIKTFKELIKRAGDLFVLGGKVITFRYGERYWAKKRKEEERKYVKEIGKIEDIRKHEEMGKKYYDKGEYKVAQDIYRRIIELDDRNREAHLKVGEIRYKEGDKEGSLIEIEKAIGLGIEEEEAYRLGGYLLKKKGLYKEAMDRFDKALKLLEGNVEVEAGIHNEKGQVYYERGEYDKALEELNRAVELNPKDANTYRLIGIIQWRKKEYEEATENLDAALQLSKGDREAEAEIFREKGQVYYEQGEYDKALEELKMAVELNPKDANTYRLIGIIQWRKKEYEEATENLDAALKLSKGDREAEAGIHNENGQVYYEQGEYDKALEELNRAVELNPKDANTYRLIGIIQWRKKEYKEAIEELKKSISIDPEDKDTQYLLGAVYKAKGLYAEAMTEFEAALKLSETDKETTREIYEKRLEICGQTKNYELMIGDLKVLIGKEPLDVSLYLWLSRAYRQEGREDEAVTAFKKAMELIDGEKGKGSKSSNTFKGKSLKEENKLLNSREISEGKVKLLSRPLSLNIVLTNRCNLNCKMCLIQGPSNSIISGKVNEEIKGIFPYLEEIAWLGGEVFLYPDFEELLDESMHYNIEQVITTNGLLLNERYTEKFVKNNICLNISIDGTTKEVYEDIRRGAKFEVLIDKLNMINRVREKYNHEYKMSMSLVVMRSNYKQLESFVEFARVYNFNTLNLIMISDNKNDQNIFNYNRDNKILSEVNRALDAVEAGCRKYNINLVNYISKGILSEGCGIQNDNNPKNVSKKKSVCLAPWKRLNVDFSGDITPQFHCSCKNIVGNLNDNTMEEIWNGEKMVKYRQSIMSGDMDKVCSLKGAYGGEIPYEFIRKKNNEREN